MNMKVYSLKIDDEEEKTLTAVEINKEFMCIKTRLKNDEEVRLKMKRLG